jgi:hypothetical protein
VPVLAVPDGQEVRLVDHLLQQHLRRLRQGEAGGGVGDQGAGCGVVRHGVRVGAGEEPAHPVQPARQPVGVVDADYLAAVQPDDRRRPIRRPLLRPARRPGVLVLLLLPQAGGQGGGPTRCGDGAHGLGPLEPVDPYGLEDVRRRAARAGVGRERAPLPAPGPTTVSQMRTNATLAARDAAHQTPVPGP